MVSNLPYAIAVLNSRLRIKGVSTQELADKVNAVNVSNGNTDAKACAPVPALNGSLNKTAASALLELAKASRTSADRTIAAAHQWWAFLRYLAYFDEKSGNLVVSDEGKSLVETQRRVASEELGVGFSLLVGRHWVQSKIPGVRSSAINVADVEQILAGSTNQIAQRPGRSKRPDWALSVCDPAYPFAVQTYLLESKGAGVRGKVESQLASAARQLNGVTVDGKAPVGLAVATVSGGGPIRYFAIDPGREPEPVEIEPDGLTNFVRDGASRRRGERPEFDARYLASSSIYWSMYGLADFARNENLASWLGETPRSYEEDNDRVRYHQTGAGPVDGVRRRWKVPGGAVSIVLGVSSEINESLLERNFGQALTRQLAWAGQEAEREEVRDRTFRTDAEVTDPGGEPNRPLTGRASPDEALATDSDGAVLSVTLE